MTDIVLATRNRGKVVEIEKKLAGTGLRIRSLDDAGFEGDIEETGATFEENAMLKAVAAMEKSGLPAFADDSGLEVDALGGAPGVYSARYAGEGASDAEKIAKLLSELEQRENRRARFVSVVACAFPDGRRFCVRGECEGRITRAPRGEGGFGYDPVFFAHEAGKTFAEMTTDEKNRVSHRARAVELFAREIVQYIKSEKEEGPAC